MCDTFVVTAEAAGDRGAIFGKNSDREPDEAQALEVVAEATHDAGALVTATRLAVPQVGRTHAALLSRPFWMWGAEMGLNAQGLAVGNEAVFTRAPMRERGLLGMDLVRLTLERAGSAGEGVTVLTELLEAHGQGGEPGYRDRSFRYHNSFLLADPEEAWVLETADRAWAAARVRGVRAISNALTLRDRYDRAMSGLAAYARDLGLARGRGPIDFARVFGAPLLGWAAGATRRRACVERFLGGGAVTVARAIAALRQHDGRAGAGLRLSVCAHASWLPTRRAGQTTSSLVCRLGEPALALVTGTPAPCLSTFKPAWVDSGLPGYGPLPGARPDPACRFWRGAARHEAARGRLEAAIGADLGARERLEAQWLGAANAARSPAERAELTAAAFGASDG